VFVGGVDGCRGGWVCFKVELPSFTNSLELIDLPATLKDKRSDLAYLQSV
jgi:hypothetical protein